MCRWLAYAGDPIPVDTLLFKPCNSLIHQSLSAQRAHVPTQGDGFGLGWYGELPKPGLYRDTMPAWNDINLRSLSEQIRSRLFFAHVRASTGTATARLNCHPFRWDRWLFMHNGRIGGWFEVRRRIEQLISPEMYRFREGSTDSEAMFYLMLSHGLVRNPAAAMLRTFADIEEAMAAEKVDEPLRVTAALTDGERIWAVRYSSDRQSPSLYYATGGGLEVEGGDCAFCPGRGTVLIVSEPLDRHDGDWMEVPEGTILVADGGRVTVSALEVVARAA
ncbi:MAG TPA: class II glutamine amidotransferase [Azospirillaceae bacterium]|nr:class II glutamine amidotransferase [Azospirillaceae bacterium]